MSSDKWERNIVIIGGGIIGCTSAYFLTRHPLYDSARHRITLLEATKIAGGASGKAGGLLGSWAYPQPLARLSFALHGELATEHGGEERWGYRRINVGSLEAQGRQSKSAQRNDNIKAEKIGALHKLSNDGSKTSRLPADLQWIDEETSPNFGEMGSPADTAQVHPYLFTTSMAQLSEAKGVNIITGSVKAIGKTKEGVQSVTYTSGKTSSEHTIPASDIIVAAGPWTPSIMPGAPITATRAHSVTIRPSSPISGYALFTEINLPRNFGQTDNVVRTKRTHKKVVTPEIYARPNNEAYACGEGDQLVPLPNTTAEVETDDARCQDIVDYVSSISRELRDGEVTARQACYLPLGGPFIGLTKTPGLFLASGHTCWGIQNAPGTGKLISEFVFDGQAKSANASAVDPRRVL